MAAELEMRVALLRNSPAFEKRSGRRTADKTLNPSIAWEAAACGTETMAQRQMKCAGAKIDVTAIHPEGMLEISRWSPTGAPPVNETRRHAS